MKLRLPMIIAVVAGLLAVVLVQLHLRSEKGPTVEVFRATETVGVGQMIGANMEMIELPGENLFPGILKEAPTAEMSEFVSTTAVKREVRAGEIILYRHLESTVDPGIRPEIPAGMKAISVEVDEVGSVSHFIEPGDLVDVIGILPVPAPASRPAGRSGSGTGTAEQMLSLVASAGGLGGGSGEENFAVPLVQAVQVLAVGNRYRRSDDPIEQQSPYNSVTLLVSLEEAQKLALAKAIGKGGMTLLLRSPGDDSKDSTARSMGLSSTGFNQVGNR